MCTTYFENKYDDFSTETAKVFLNTNNDFLCDDYLTKLLNFKSTKLNYLITKMKNDIFYNESVYTGSAGLALYFLISSQRNGNSQELLNQAVDYINLKNLKGKKISFICGDAGPIAIASVISFNMSEKKHRLPKYKALVERLITLGSVINESPDELLYGKCGYLYALLFVKKNIAEETCVPITHIQKVIQAILQSGKRFALEMDSVSPLLWQWHGKIYYGAAHGMAGILYILLQAQAYVDAVDMQNLIKPTIDWLINQKYSSGNFPSSMGSHSGDRLIQWCHGAPGFVALCLLASQVFGDDKYVEVALEAGNVIWKRGLCNKGYSLCHGVSGNAYAFIQLYQFTKNPQHLYRACCFMQWCTEERPGTELHPPDRPASLFEGLLGRLFLAEDLLHITDAKFPAMTV